VPGIFFKFDLDPLALTIRERTTTLYQFLIRLAGVVGGVWTVASFGLRTLMRAQQEVTKAVGREKQYIPSSVHIPSPLPTSDSGSYFGAPAASMSRAASWMSRKDSPSLGTWKGQ
jgi:hypothetical protein